MKRWIILLCLFLGIGKIGAQTFYLGTDVGGSFSGTAMTNTGHNVYEQTRQESSSTTGRKWEFYDGGSYFNNWRPYISGQTLSSFNSIILPASNTASATWNNNSGGQSGLLPATTSGTYYSFRISSPGYYNQNMVVLATTYTPTSLASATHTQGTNIVTLSNALNTGEYMYVRYSTTSNFTSSTIQQLTFSGTTGTFTFGGSCGTLYYYFYTSNITLTNINTAVNASGGAGESVHDLFTLKYLNNGGSYYTKTVNAPTPTISGSTSVCGGANITLSGTPTVASGSSFDGSNTGNFTWSSSNTSAATVSSPVSTAVTVTGTPAGGSTTITYTIKDNFGCSGSGTYPITANPKPLISGATAAATICSQYPATINLTGLTPSSIFSISYNISHGTEQFTTGIMSNASGVGSFTTINIPSNGTNWLSAYSVNLDTIKNTTTTCFNNSITPTSSVTLTVNRGPLPTISGSSSVCVGGSLTLTGTPNLQTGSSPTFLWSSSNTSVATISGSNTNTSATIMSVSAGSTIISYYVKGNNGCDSTATKTITVNANPTVSIAATESSCTANDNKVLSGAAVSLTATGAGGSGSYSTYTWDNSLGTGATQTPTVSATTTYNVTVTDSNGCIGTNSKTETLITSPTVSIAATENSCTANDNKVLSGATVNLTAIGAGGSGTYSTYTWDNSLGTGAAKTPTVTATTTYNVTVTDSNGCTGTNVQTETLITSPTVSIAATESSCTANDNKVLSGATVSLSATGAGGSGTYSNYTWDNSLGTGATKTPTVTATTTYNVTVTDGNGCTGTNARTETLITSPTVSIAATENSCTANDNKVLSGATVNLTASGSGGSGTYSTYTWDNSLGTGATKTPAVSATTTYNVTVTDSNGCTGTNAQTETLITAPSFSNTKVNDPCQIGAGSITVTLTGGTPTYTIAACGTTIAPSSLPGTYITVSGSPTTISSSGGSKTFSNLQGNANYNFTITDANGCPAQ